MIETTLPRPDWLRVRAPTGANYRELKTIMRDLSLHTVCEEARCPNIGECWESRTATFMILGDVCTRACGFCAVKTGRPLAMDLEEPGRVAAAATTMGLEHVVVTSVNRDDAPDGGAAVFAATIRQLRRRLPTCTVEVLIPDFQGDEAALRTVMDAGPDILNHNVETVPRLTKRVRRRAKYERSLEVLRRAKAMAPKGLTKSGIMLGLGERHEEILDTLADLRAAAVDVVTIGQYLRPGPQYLPIERYYTPEEFAAYKVAGEQMGFRHVESGPLVRSSYHAKKHAQMAGSGA